MNFKKNIKIIVLLFILINIGACVKNTTTIKYLNDEELNWLPYSIGDTLFYYQNDSLKGKRYVVDIRQDYIFNKKMSGKENSHSQTKEIYFNTPEDKLFLPMSFFISYQNDVLSLVDKQFCNTCKWIDISSGETTFIKDGNNIKTEVKILKQDKKYSNSIYYFKQTKGLVQFTNIIGETFTITTKRKK